MGFGGTSVFGCFDLATPSTSLVFILGATASSCVLSGASHVLAPSKHGRQLPVTSHVSFVAVVGVRFIVHAV